MVCPDMKRSYRVIVLLESMHTVVDEEFPWVDDRCVVWLMVFPVIPNPL